MAQWDWLCDNLTSATGDVSKVLGLIPSEGTDFCEATTWIKCRQSRPDLGNLGSLGTCASSGLLDAFFGAWVLEQSGTIALKKGPTVTDPDLFCPVLISHLTVVLGRGQSSFLSPYGPVGLVM